MASKASRQGLYFMLVRAIGVGLAWVAVTFAIQLFNAQPAGNAGGIALVIIFFVCLLGMAITWVRSRVDRGILLLDCGPFPNRWGTLGLAASVLAMSSGFDAAFGSPFGSLFGFLFAGFWLFISTGRLGVYEQGIWVFFALMRWELIGDYSWEDDGTLSIVKKGHASSMRSALTIPSEHRDEVARLLSIYLPDLENG